MTFTGIMVAWCLLTPGPPEDAECMSSRVDRVKVENGMSRSQTCTVVFDNFREAYRNNLELHNNNYKISCSSKTIYIDNKDA